MSYEEYYTLKHFSWYRTNCSDYTYFPFQIKSHMSYKTPSAHWKDYSPTPLWTICDNLGIKIEMVRNPGWQSASRTKLSPIEAKIWLNENISDLQKREHLAHQMYHVIYGSSNKDYVDLDVLSNPSQEEEKYADRFALYLLMPKFFFSPCVNYTNLSIKEMADLFQVSINSVCNRLEMLQKGMG